MCVVANGYSVGEVTHVSVYIFLNRGEYDDQLKWPFRGEVTIQLLNQSGNEGHWEETFYYDDSVSNAVAGRVVGRQRAPTCKGYSQFIAHTDLRNGNQQYLRNDCLKFRISGVVVKSI